MDPPVGDGQFQETTQQFFHLRLPGYEVQFKEFPLETTYSGTYLVGEVPELDKEVTVELFLVTPCTSSTEWEDRLAESEAKICVRVFDSNENLVTCLDSPLKDLIWWYSGGENETGGYSMSHGQFRPKPREEYKLQVSYSGDPQLTGQMGAVRLVCSSNI